MNPSQNLSAGLPSKDAKAPKISEDVLALIVGLSLFVVSLAGLGGLDVFGWVVKANVWTSVSEIMTPVSQNYPRVKGVAALRK